MINTLAYKCFHETNIFCIKYIKYSLFEKPHKLKYASYLILMNTNILAKRALNRSTVNVR